jgi:hypothetical protein
MRNQTYQPPISHHLFLVFPMNRPSKYASQLGHVMPSSLADPRQYIALQIRNNTTPNTQPSSPSGDVTPPRRCATREIPLVARTGRRRRYMLPGRGAARGGWWEVALLALVRPRTERYHRFKTRKAAGRHNTRAEARATRPAAPPKNASLRIKGRTAAFQARRRHRCRSRTAASAHLAP